MDRKYPVVNIYTVPLFTTNFVCSLLRLCTSVVFIANNMGPNQSDQYSNLFLNAYINRHGHAEYLKMIEVYSPLGIWHVSL